MDHHQREQRRAAAQAFHESLEQLADCFHAEDLSIPAELLGEDEATAPGEPAEPHFPNLSSNSSLNQPPS